MSSNKSIKFPLILACIALVVWVAASFLGFVYTGVDTFVSVIFVFAILLLMGLGLWLMIQSNLAADSTSRKKKQIRLAGWALFIVGAVVSLFFLNHFVKVWIDKPEVQNEARMQLDELNTTFAESPEENSYKKYINRQKAFLTDFLTGVEDSKRRSLLFDFESTVEKNPENGSNTYFNIRKEVLEKTEEYQKSVESWNPFSIANSLKELANNKPVWEGYARLFSEGISFSNQVGQTWKPEPFEPISVHNGDLSEKVSSTDFGTNWQAIVSAILLLLLMLLPVILTTQLAGNGNRAKGISTI